MYFFLIIFFIFNTVVYDIKYNIFVFIWHIVVSNQNVRLNIILLFDVLLRFSLGVQINVYIFLY